MVRKFCLFIGVLACMILFSLCGCSRKTWLNKTNSEISAIKRTGEILVESIKGNNIEDFSKLLSHKAIQSDDLKEKFSKLHNVFINERIIEIEYIRSPIEEHIEMGEKWKRSLVLFNVKTEYEKVYILEFEYWFFNEADKTLEGVNRIDFYEESDIELHAFPDSFSEYSGIYSP